MEGLQEQIRILEIRAGRAEHSPRQAAPEEQWSGSDCLACQPVECTWPCSLTNLQKASGQTVTCFVPLCSVESWKPVTKLSKSSFWVHKLTPATSSHPSDPEPTPATTSAPQGKLPETHFTHLRHIPIGSANWDIKNHRKIDIFLWTS